MHESSGPSEFALEFRMHDRLRDLGRQIVEEESPDNPLMRSRMWHKEDIISAIGHAEETSTVQGIMWRGRVDFGVEQVDSLLSMHDLKFMFCWGLFLKREITNLPRNLRYLVLSNCGLNQQRSFSEMLSSTESYCPKAIGQLKNLRYLDMSSTRLRFLPIEFGQLLSLEELYLVKCSLIELPHSFGNLIKLKFLDISRNGLKSFPANFSQLRSLEYLNASSNEFEELPALPEGLLYLDVRDSYRLQKLQPISHITRLHTIELGRGPRLTELPKLDTLHSVTKLNLEGCKFLKELPALDTMHSLRRLILDRCSKLEKLPALPAGPIHVTTNGCFRLQNNCCTDKRKRPVVDVNEEIPAVDVNKEFILLDGKRRRVSEQSEVGGEGMSADTEEIFFERIFQAFTK